MRGVGRNEALKNRMLQEPISSSWRSVQHPSSVAFGDTFFHKGRRGSPVPPTSNHARLVAAGVALDAGDVGGGGDEVGKRFLRVVVVPGLVRLVALDIDAQRSPRGAGAG